MLMVPGELPPVASAPYVRALLVVVEDMVPRWAAAPQLASAVAVLPRTRPPMEDSL